ncbi:hypothetical protein Tco_0262197 [Tanacetum coccineum]
MAIEDNPPPQPHASTDKIIPFSIPNKIPIKLDLEKLNYNSWSSFSLIHLGSLGLKSHVEEDTASINPEWCQLDDLIKMWILGSLCDSLQEQDARAINLDNELRSIKIGKMTVNEYCTKIKSMANRLKNLDCQVSEKNLVIYVVNGLDSRFATLVEIIRHREPLPTFETVRNMLLLKESSFNEPTDASTMLESSSSSPTILMASSSSDAKVQPNSHGILGAALALYLSQPTLLPSAFSTMMLQDLTWNMDTGATSHLISNARNLSTTFNKGNGNSILVTNTGHSIVPSLHRPLHLHNVLVTANIPFINLLEIIIALLNLTRLVFL